jgi:D-sedoheptulose 7-phosphate isomerase
LACGDGGSAAAAQHFVAEVVGRMARARRAVPGSSPSAGPCNVTALANDHGFERVFASQVEELGAPGDVLLCVATSGRAPDVLCALETARSRGLATILLVGAKPPGGADVCISIPSQNGQRVQEIHIAVLHALCDRIERHFFDE